MANVKLQQMFGIYIEKEINGEVDGMTKDEIIERITHGIINQMQKQVKSMNEMQNDQGFKIIFNLPEDETIIANVFQ
jgi:hypothetical protein